MITVCGLTFAYPGRAPVLHNLDLTIRGGTYTAVMGPNGSGKTTLALLVKGLLSPAAGDLSVDGIQSVDENSRYEIMKRVGLVFQNPENTIVATTVETELAFGLENLGIPADEMRVLVDDALRRFNLTQYRHTSPSNLSGGEKQRLALASVMIMKPSCLILDEPTSLLDPPSRATLLNMIRETARGGATVINITQFSFEALQADRLIVLNETGISHDGVPENVLGEMSDYLTGGMEILSSSAGISEKTIPETLCGERAADSDTVVFDRAGFTYNPGTPYEHRALGEISLRFPTGSSTVLMGPSGSGKTTLLEIAAGITMPTEGRVLFADGSSVRAMAFQLPEDQIFGATVGSYVAFGPGNLGLRGNDLDRAVTDALRAVGFDPDEYRDRDPYELSGGEKRRAALAGVLAMKPGVLILDEPTAGLDRKGLEMVTAVLKTYHGCGGTLIFSTHDFEVASRLADRAVVLDNGRIETSGTTEEVFRKSPWLCGLRS